MFYILISLFFILIQSYLILTTNFNIFPELYFFPYLVNKGLLPYRDFFDHHGFLFYYILAPLTSDKTFISMKIFYYLINTLNLTLILIILKRSTTRLGYILGGFVFLLLNFFIGENNLWYETIITTIFLIIYSLLITHSTYKKDLLIGFMISLASFLKPIAAIIIIPITFSRKKFTTFYSFIFSWILILIYFFTKHSLSQLYQNLFLFNQYLTQSYHPIFFSDIKFLLSSIFLVIYTLYLAYINKKIKKNILLLSLLISSGIFLITGYGRWHLLPIFSFFSIFISQTFKYKNTLSKIIFMFFLLIFTSLLSKKVISHQMYLNKVRLPWQENIIGRQIIDYLRKTNLTNTKFYLLSNHPEIYMYFDQLPPTYFALKFPLVETYFQDYEKRIINDLNINQVEIIIVPQNLEKEYMPLMSFFEYIKQNYKIIEDNPSFKVYQKSLKS